MTIETGFASSGELRMYYELHGEPVPGTRPLLLIHGGGATIQTNWEHLIPLVTPSRQVIAVEEQGHGRTQPIDRELTPELSADDVAATLTQLGLGPVDVLGFSSGGRVALALAVRHPQLVGRLIVASGFARRDDMIDGFWQMLGEATLAGMPQVYRDADLALNDGDPAHLQRLFDIDSRRMLTSPDLSEEALAAISAPTLVVIADRDVVTVEGALRLSRSIPDARLMVVPGNHGDYLGERGSFGGDTAAVRRTVPWLLAFLDE
ncbi:alpha/beta fold hydrolase [Lysinimonas soli]|uniref:Alpha/beta fold hydrolase n=1 Tax=Lysinimonas soli TaxID=1074233 RepID=A0ABW0NNW3_9MICO